MSNCDCDRCSARRDESAERIRDAAPDLLQACQTFVEWLRRESAGSGTTRADGTRDETKWRKWYAENLRLCDLAQSQARAAIAKALDK